MEQINARVKRWGNSLGIILPRIVVENQKLKEGAEISVTVQAKRPMKVADILGLARNHPLHSPRKDTGVIMREIDLELYGTEEQ